MYQVLLKSEGESDGIYLPVNPESLEVTMGAKNESFFLLAQGEAVNPATPLCRTITFSSFLPASANPYGIIEGWQRYLEQKKVLRLVVCGKEPWGSPRFELNLPVVTEKIKYAEKGGEPGVVFFTMTLREYRPFSLKVIS